MAFSEAYWKNKYKDIQIAIWSSTTQILSRGSLISVIYMDEVSGLLHFF